MPEVDPNTSAAIAGGGDVRPNVAFATAGPTPTAPDMGQGAVATAPAQAPLAAPQSPSAQPITATSPNKHLMSLGARILGALAGEEKSYSYDDNGRLSSASQPLTTTQKIGRIIGKATTALAAPTPEGRTSLAANVGAGANAVKQQSQGQEVLKRAQAKEEFEQEQQAKVRKYEIARQNALTLSTYYGAKKAANEMDPHFAQNESLLNSVKASPELGAHATEMSDTQVEQEAAKDPTFSHTHIIKPLGWAPETDPTTGQQVQVNGEPKFYMRMAVIDGTKDGKIKVTPEMAADMKTYGPMARVPNAGDVKAGDEYELSSLIPLMNKIDEQKKSVLQGWEHSEVGLVDDPKKPGKQTAVETNKVIPYGMPGRTRPLVATPLGVASEEGKTALEKAQAFEAEAKGKEALANAASIAAWTIPEDGDMQKNTLPDYWNALQEVQKTNPAGYKILKSVPPIYQKAVLLVANGDATIDDATKNPRKGVPVITPLQMETYASLVNPKWTKQMFKTKQDAAEDMLRKNGDAIKSFGQFGVHVGDLKEVSERLQRTQSPWINAPLNEIKSRGVGQPGVPGLMAAVEAVRSEWLNAIKSGHAADLEASNESRKIMDDTSTPLQILDASRVMGSQVIGRLDQIDNIWRRSWGGHYPGILSDSARSGFESIGLGDQIKQYPREAGPMFGAREGGYGQPNAAPPTTNPNPDQYAPNVDPKNVHSDGKVTIGWDPQQKTWVDAFTGKVYNQAPPQGQQ